MLHYNLPRSAKDLTPLVTGILHHFAGTAVQIHTVEDWGIGALNCCLKVTTRSPAAAFFLKIENEHILPVSRRGQISREVHGSRLMHAVGVACPAVLDFDEHGDRFGIRYLVQEFIEGSLMWELRDSLAQADRDQLKTDILAILVKMRAASSPVFGDLYPGGWIGQFPTYAGYFRRQAAMDLDDCRTLELLSSEEAALLSTALDQAAAAVACEGPAAFYHGDLGIHNLLARVAPGGPRLGWVIDFGNALFLPAYRNEDGVRRHGGFDLPILDPSAYGVAPRESAANQLLDALNWTAFAGMLCRTGRWNRDPREFVTSLLENARAFLDS